MENEQAKTRQEGIVYQGIQKEINGKAIFMRECLHYKACLEMLLEKLKDVGLADKLKYSGMYMKSPQVACLTIHEEDLALLFDELYQGKLAQFMRKTEDPLWEIYTLPMSMNGEEIHLDITYLLVYGIVINERCRQALAQEVKDRNTYYAHYENSYYKNSQFEGFFRADQIWDVRLLIGLLEQMRAGGEERDYRLLMKIIYAGYGHIKRQIKGRRTVDGATAKGILKKDVSEENSMLPTVSRFMLLMAMAEDLGIRYLWDYDTLVMVHFYESSIDLLTNGEREHERLEDFEGSGQEEFRQKYEEQYGNCRSLLGLISGGENDRLGELMVRVFDLYQISPRKFWEFDLTGEEAEKLIRQSDRWSKRTYATGLILAQLCKYIRQLEEQYLTACGDYDGMQLWIARQEKEAACWQRQQRDKELSQILSEKRALEGTILKQEQELEKLKKQLDAQEEQGAEQLQELQEIRSYVYSLSESWEEKETGEPKEAELFDWKDKRVLVVGGHINWQNKMREMFPKWQFILPGQNSLDGNMIKGKDLIICNTQVLAHSCYYKIVSGRERGQKLYYVHSNNIQKCLQELRLQLLA